MTPKIEYWYSTIVSIALTSIIIVTGWFIAGFRPEVAQWTVLALGALLVIQGGYFLLQKKDIPVHTYSFLFIPALVYILISVFWITPTRWLGFEDFFLFFQAFIVFFLVAQNATDVRFYRIFVVGLVLLGLLEVGVALYQYKVEAYWLPMGYRLPVYSGRSSGTFGNPGHFAAFMSLLFFPSLALFLKGRVRGWLRGVLVLLVCVWATGILLAASRGPILGLFVGICAMPLLLCETFKKQVYTWAIIILTLTCLHITASYTVEVYKRRDVFNLSHIKEDTRWVQWKAAYNIFVEDPILGSGAGSYDTLFERYRPKQYLHTPIWVHNEYLNTLSDYGLIGFCLFFVPGALVFFLCFRNFWRLPFEDRWSDNERVAMVGIIFSLLAFFIHTVFDFTFRIPTLFFAFSLLLALLAGRVFPAHILPRGGVRLLGLGCAVMGVLVPLYAIPKYKAASMEEHARHEMNEVLVSFEKSKHPMVLFSPIVDKLEMAKRLDGSNPEVLSSLALAYYYSAKAAKSEGDLEQSQQFARSAVAAGFDATELCSQDWFFWVSYGLSLGAENQFQAGQSAMKTAVDLAPNESMAWFYYAIFLSTDKSRPDRALEALDKALEINPFNHRAITLKSLVQGEMQ